MQYSGVSILAETIRPANRRASQLAVTILTMLSLNSGKWFWSPNSFVYEVIRNNL